jgi:diaminohydroxyphosphoribosylaminopyrimidine deaminase/5-amino-6-(5-phosphoribosylamino)uracil reductase
MNNIIPKKQIRIDRSNELFMHRCLELASNGLGYVEPNPMVGAVIVHKGEVIGEGYHRHFGQAHAEVHAIRSVKDDKILRSSTLYVNLEPCVHTGKTPPCTDLILEKKIPAVVIGTSDPNSLVAGKGIERLKKHGVKVINGILENDCYILNRRFFTFHKLKRPYVILKWAQTQDGFIDKQRKHGEPIGVNWISNPFSLNLVHKWRTEEQSIMVGTNTIVKDNPMLNVRYWIGRNPVRVIIDRKLRIPKTYNIWDDSQKTLIFNEKKNGKHGQTEWIKISLSDYNLNEVFHYLYQKNIVSIMVEGGKELLEYLIRSDLWDEARIFKGDKIFKKGVKAPELISSSMFQCDILNDKLIFYRNLRKSNYSTSIS